MSRMHVHPTSDQLVALSLMPSDTAVSMLNLVRLRERAAYEDGRLASGAEAYKTYGRHSGKVFARVGGTLIWRGDPKAVLIGPEAERWDIAFIARYPSVTAFRAMLDDPEYKKILHHRTAAVADSRLIAFGDHEADPDQIGRRA